MADTVIKAELTLEDLTSEILKQVRSETDKTAASAEKAQHSFSDFAKNTVSFLNDLGVNLTQVAMKTAEWAKSFVEVAGAGQTADTALAAMMATSQDRGFGEVIEDAQNLGDELDGIAAKTGAIGDLGAAFNNLVLYTGATEAGVEKASNQIYDMAQISRVLGRDVGSVTQEFALMQEGTLKVKGQLFQLLQSTGMFGNDARKAAAAWGTMTEEKRVKILDAAVSQVSGKLKDIPQTFANRVSSFHAVVDALKEKIGEPLMDVLVPAVAGATDKLVELTPEIVAAAKAFGKDVGHWVTGAMSMMRDGFHWVQTHHDEILAALNQGWDYARSTWTFIKSVVDFIVANKEVFMAIGAGLAVNKGANMAGDVAKFAGELKNSITGLSNFQKGLIAATAAAAAWAIAYDQFKQRGDATGPEYETDLSKSDTRRIGRNNEMDQLLAAAGRGDVGMISRHKEGAALKTSELGRDIGFGGNGIDYDSYLKMAQDKAEAIQKAGKLYAENIATAAQLAADASAEAAAKHTAVSGMYAAAVADASVSKIIQAYNFAVENHQAASQQFAESLIMNSTELRAAFDHSSQEIAGGMLAMIKTVQNIGAAAASGAAGGSIAAPKLAIGGMTGSGNVTVNMKQEFRNADPDRIAVAFEKSFQRMSERRLTAMTSTPFGT